MTMKTDSPLRLGLLRHLIRPKSIARLRNSRLIWIHFRVLTGVSKDSDDAKIKSAYKKLGM